MGGWMTDGQEGGNEEGGSGWNHVAQSTPIPGEDTEIISPSWLHFQVTTKRADFEVRYRYTMVLTTLLCDSGRVTYPLCASVSSL